MQMLDVQGRVGTWDNTTGIGLELELFHTLDKSLYTQLSPLKYSLSEQLNPVEKELCLQLHMQARQLLGDVDISTIHAVLSKLFQLAREDLGLHEYNNDLLMLSRAMVTLMVTNFSGEIGDALSDDLWKYGHG